MFLGLQGPNARRAPVRVPCRALHTLLRASALARRAVLCSCGRAWAVPEGLSWRSLEAARSTPLGKHVLLICQRLPLAPVAALGQNRESRMLDLCS